MPNVLFWSAVLVVFEELETAPKQPVNNKALTTPIMLYVYFARIPNPSIMFWFNQISRRPTTQKDAPLSCYA